uniref:G-protein coupled receptors family 1 profile domain-containing protein n=1 Tax=Parascaris univalens TaxID=6257 RepID=A0A915C5Z1_PARUN
MIHWAFMIYVIQGAALFLTNALFVLAIARSNGLIGKYTILFAKFITDALSGLAEVLGGAGRLIVIASGDETLRCRRFCMLMPWNIFFTWTEPMTAIMLLIVSIDRLFCVAMPIQYYKSGKEVQCLQILISHMFVSFCILTNWLITFSDTVDQFSPLCWTTDGWAPFYEYFSYFLRMGAAISSVLLYPIVIIAGRRYSKSMVQRQGDAFLKAYESRQRQLTITLGISSIVTLIFYVIPVSIESLTKSLRVEHRFGDLTTVYAVISSNLNPIFNILVIVSRQKDIARAVHKVFADWSCRRTTKVFALRHEQVSATKNITNTTVFKSIPPMKRI